MRLLKKFGEWRSRRREKLRRNAANHAAWDRMRARDRGYDKHGGSFGGPA